MTKASNYLFKATHSRAYFNGITILLPHTWSHDPSYGAVTSETVNMADVIITSTVRKKRSLPQARSYRGCGKQGVHILLPVKFLTSPRPEPFYADPGESNADNSNFCFHFFNHIGYSQLSISRSSGTIFLQVQITRSANYSQLSISRSCRDYFLQVQITRSAN